MNQEYQKVKVTDIQLDKPIPVNILVPRSEIIQKIRLVAQKKVQETLLQSILLGILGGFYQSTAIHFGVRAISALTTSHVDVNSVSIKITKIGTGVQMGIYSGLFPIGMLLILINGGDIFLMQLFYYVIAMFKKSINIKKAALKLLIVFMANWAAAIFYSWFFIYLTKLFDTTNYKDGINMLTSKYLDFAFFQTLLLGVGGGIVISFAFMINMAGKSALCRIMSIWSVIGLYPILYFQHFQDALTLFPITIWLNGQVSVGDFVGKNLIPVFIGNVIGVLMIAVAYAISEDTEEQNALIHLTPIKDHEGMQDEIVTKH